MQFYVRHSLPGRIRVGYDKTEIAPRQAALVRKLLSVQDGVLKVSVNPVTARFLVLYDAGNISEKSVLDFLKRLSSKYLDDEELLKSVEEPKSHPSLVATLAQMTALHYVKKFLPPQVRLALRVIDLAPRIWKGFKTLASGEPFRAEVLDATAITMSVVTGDISTAANINFMLSVGETIEDFTKKESYRNLANTILSENDKVQLVVGKSEKTVHLYEIKPGDTIAVRTGGMIPADGEVLRGEALVNQATITGEPLPVEKQVSATVFAGTVVTEGELFVKVRVVGSQTKVQNILSMIDSSQQYKVSSQIRSEKLADHLVKYNFLLALGTFLVTRNISKTLATLMVDYSCAMKLAAPIAILSAMREAAQSGILVKGGKFFEDAANADTVVFDKTGTLTAATPRLSRIIPFQGLSENDVLRVAACLEEHFAHPVAKAIVQASNQKKLRHPEDHAKVEYVIAHGIATTLNGKKLLIGSKHFIFEDEKVKEPKGIEKLQQEAIDRGESLLYLAEKGKLLGILAVTDPVRENAKEIIDTLHRSGIQNCTMITGDDEGAARTAARLTGIDHYISRALPEDKVAYITAQKNLGYKVIMIGDGINDAPALVNADAGIAMGDSAAITGETADIVLSSADGLEGLVKVRTMGSRLMQKIDDNNLKIVVVNTALMFSGLFGFLPPATAALFHNLSTILFSAKAAEPLMKG
jgi:heavy metal translocating P-type ATPase